MKFELSNILAVIGAISAVAGVCMFSIAAGFIVLGIFLILGAVATARPDPKSDVLKKAHKQ